MTMLELSLSYRASAAEIHLRLTELRLQAQAQPDAEALRALEERIRALVPLLREMQELAQLTAHYYERGYCRNEKYIL